jgi:hypothetical protein
MLMLLQGRVAAVAEAFAVSGHDQAVVLYRRFRGDASNDACNFHVPLTSVSFYTSRFAGRMVRSSVVLGRNTVRSPAKGKNAQS